jgi:hypothetical protein
MLVLECRCVYVLCMHAASQGPLPVMRTPTCRPPLTIQTTKTKRARDAAVSGFTEPDRPGNIFRGTYDDVMSALVLPDGNQVCCARVSLTLGRFISSKVDAVTRM